MFAPRFYAMPRHKLKNAPLQEVIFELFWKLPLDESGFPYDPGIDRALGKFETAIVEHFPVYKRTMPEGLNLRVYPKPIHQFWKGELTWPVIQIGPGILAVNDTDLNYSWKDNFQANIQRAVDALKRSYASGLQLERAKLQYIDAVEYDPAVESPQDFIARNLNTELQNRYPVSGNARGVNVSQSFQMPYDSALLLNIQTGRHNKTGNPAIIWITAVERAGDFDFQDLDNWLEFAHETTSETFVSMLNREFYAGFD
jgi:uncharacterized protein (TIGR04255 family)